MADFFATFLGNEAVVATAAAMMRDRGLSPDDVLRLYDAWIAEGRASMIPATPEYVARARLARSRAIGSPDTRIRPGQADTEHRLGACPVCGGEVWGIKKCPHVSPPWRTFFACDSDECQYHGRSRLTVEQLRRKWPEGAEADSVGAVREPPLQKQAGE